MDRLSLASLAVLLFQPRSSEVGVPSPPPARLSLVCNSTAPTAFLLTPFPRSCRSVVFGFDDRACIHVVACGKQPAVCVSTTGYVSEASPLLTPVQCDPVHLRREDEGTAQVERAWKVVEKHESRPISMGQRSGIGLDTSKDG